MITLKDYQSRVLESLRCFFRECSISKRPEAAFQTVQVQNYQTPIPYFPVNADGLSGEMPYICLRVPTGGGKTLLACHSAGIAIEELLQADRAVVLWLVPTTKILEQTADALRDSRHPYRRALELSCGNVEVYTIEEALNLSLAAVNGATIIIVSTIQCFRTEDTTGRKVYDQNGSFSEHLLNVTPDRLADLLPGADGRPKPSLVNMLRLRRPIVIVDEAHNARTDLSFTTLGNVRPSCIIEFTATPARKSSPSNVLHRVSAAELKAAEMIKLPLRVITRHPSQADQLLSEAVTLRTELEQLAGLEGQQTGEYIRPILLIQANRVDDCEPLRDKLVADFGFVADEVKISVGSLDELPDGGEINLPRCKVRCIITVQKLREGWDCPFAYILCSLKETRSATAIEQIVGRVLRLPNARLKQNDGLNCSYVLSLSGSGTSITDVLSELRDALENHGFTTTEAQSVIIPMIQATLSLGFMPQTVQVDKSDLNSERAEEQVKALSGKVRIDTDKGAITIVVPLDEAETEQLTSCVKSAEAKERIRKTNEDVCAADAAFGGTGKSRELCPYEQRIPFRAPLMAVRDQQELFEFESTVLLEQPWKLSAKDASLDESYNPLVRPIGAAGTVDVGKKGELKLDILDANQATDFVTTLHQQLLQLGVDSDWTMDGLVAWLDRHIGHSDIPMSESAAFLSKVVRGLITKFGIEDIGLLAIDRYRLRLEIEHRIEKHRQSERKKALQKFLLPQSELTVTDEFVINFANTPYEPSWVYEGGFKFKKHYYGPKPGELLERTPDRQIKEEFRCAQFIDNLKDVQFWVRNLSAKRTSFRLLTSQGFFYPDFVCQLIDGRILVVEYKGGHLWEGAEEKRNVGAVWEERSNGTCLFVMPTDNNFDSITAKIAAR